MIRTAFAFFFLFLGQIAFGQITLKQIWSPDGSGDGRAADHVIIDFVNCGYAGTLPEGTKLRPYTMGFNINVTRDIRFGESNLSMGWGGGVSSHNVHSNARFVSIVDSSKNSTYTNLQPWHQSYNYKKNKVVFNYLDMPLELRYKSKNEVDGYAKRPVRITLGFRVGYLVNSHDKRVDTEGRFKNYNIEHILQYRYGVYTRLGYGKVSLFLGYTLTPVFEEGRGIQLNQYSAGLSFAPF
jgi:hypothetical protein